MINVEITFTGKMPLVIHNVRLANPLDPYAKAMKAITSKRTKTDDDHLEKMHIEWEGGLYIDEEHGPYLPCSYPTAALRAAGAITRQKTALQRGLMISAPDGGERIPIIYDGPRDLDRLWEDEQYRDVRLVKVQASRVPRCRPRFPQWEISFRALIDPEVLDLDIVESVIDRCGRMVGIGEAAEGSRARFSSTVKELTA